MFQNPKNVATKFTRNWLIVKFLQEFIELYTFLDIYILKKKVTLITWFFRTSFVHPFILLIYYSLLRISKFNPKKKKRKKRSNRIKKHNLLTCWSDLFRWYQFILKLLSSNQYQIIPMTIDLPKFVLVLIGFSVTTTSTSGPTT